MRTYVMMRFNRESGKVELIDPPRLDLLIADPYSPYWDRIVQRRNALARGSQPLSCQLLPFPRGDYKEHS